MHSKWVQQETTKHLTTRVDYHPRPLRRRYQHARPPQWYASYFLERRGKDWYYLCIVSRPRRTCVRVEKQWHVYPATVLMLMRGGLHVRRLREVSSHCRQLHLERKKEI